MKNQGWSEILEIKIQKQKEHIQNLENQFDEDEWDYLDMLIYI